MTDAPVSLVALRQRREATIARLCDHFAQDHLEAEELEQLIDRAHHAATFAELDALLAGLPAAPIAAPRPAGAPARSELHSRNEPQFVVAVMGGACRRGEWTPARQIYVAAVMGGAELDFRDVHLPPGVTEIGVIAIMGGVEIIVPPGLVVESDGIGIMGGFGHGGRGKFPVDSTGPVLRITGLALMGGVEIKERPARERSSAGQPWAVSERDLRRLDQGEARDATRLGRRDP